MEGEIEKLNKTKLELEALLLKEGESSDYENLAKLTAKLAKIDSDIESKVKYKFLSLSFQELAYLLKLSSAFRRIDGWSLRK